MLATLLPDLLTHVTLRDVLTGIRSAYETVEGVTPSKPCLAILTAQSALESGRWRSCHRFNLGNVKAGQSYEGYYTQFRCNEVLKDKLEWFDPPHPQTNFRAFLSLEGGCLDHVRILKRRFPGAFGAAKAGDPALFGHALKLERYYTADEAPYVRAVTSLTSEYLRSLEEPMRDTEPVPLTEADVCDALRCVAPDEFRWLDPAIVYSWTVDAAMDAAREERNRNLREP